ncbi:MAG TPA: hypothetical protein VKO83_02395 [Steroidobacteraceae bacterium]|nr:hypothetical protein [Steroidobacteraceae bacterium]
MVNIADSYFEAIEHANGRLAPFSDDCVRRENGGQTTHNAKPVPWPVPLGGSSSSMQAGELFRIDRGRIVAVEAMGAQLPYGTKSGWRD